MPSLASGAKATFTLTIRAATPGKVTVTAKVDPKPRSNAASTVTITH